MTKKERKEIRYTNRMLERMFKGYVNYRNETNEETSEKLIEKVNKKIKICLLLIDLEEPSLLTID